MPHSYEEVREAVVDSLLQPSKGFGQGPPDQWMSLVSAVAERLAPAARERGSSGSIFGDAPRADPHDAELLRDVFWDLFRQGYITLGINSSNPGWPFFRLSHFGRNTLAIGTPHRFHDIAGYVRMLREAAPEISDVAVTYVEEAVASFYAGCMLATAVMLGAAAEAEFIRLTEVAESSVAHGSTFKGVSNERFIKTRITKFNQALAPLRSSLKPKRDFEDLDTNLTQIQAVIRAARNDAGHPSASPPPSREQAYVNLQLFVPLARQMTALGRALT
ncbi:hypothetical protein [Methylobacterium haplocladii]|uniref:Uncharacterized protein n=1 Tax=Methylobacterium haplocladii TaxID=1176176 RepID=A0A512IUW2_9HYPH|nr:hypothetical protein [Methylobacterium haplocladii]GEP01494.1 hypothetical protein MHA02_38810 [Methylobacterium haplocladii]GJD82321.1 hypothetical protein HPGCJGGD_0173 [Methylobacterium haplocladii]GLS59145.1 hypothetical protein GCM10007887_18110 [Methylobacterium haplocladii]